MYNIRYLYIYIYLICVCVLKTYPVEGLMVHDLGEDGDGALVNGVLDV
jgi:hypothetical protein